MGRWHTLTGLAMLASALMAAVAPASSAASSERLVLSPAGLIGLRPGHASLATARADLGGRLSGRLGSAVASAQIQVSGAAGPRESLRSEAFVFGSTGIARGVLAGWRRVHRARRASLGEDGAIALGRGGGADLATVAWREGEKVGLLVLRAGRGTSNPAAAAVQFARLADSALRAPLPTTAWGRVLDQIRPDGSVSESTALQAFALAYGPVPGVHPPAGQSQSIPDATLAAAWILRYRQRLPSRQRRVVDRLLGLSANGASITAHAALYGDPGFVPDAQLQSLAQSWVPVFANRLNHQLGLSLVVGTTTTPLGTAANGKPAFADALPISILGGNVFGLQCRIRLGSSVQINTYLELALAHEVFHCFQFDLAPSTWKTIPDWIMEGMADWAALSVDPVSYANTDGALGTYLTSTRKPLFSRDYDAVGFWGHVQDVTGNLWSRVAQILNAGGNGASYVAAVGASNFLPSWGSSPFRTVPASTDWAMLSPISPPGPGAIPLGQKTILFGDGDVYADPWSTSQFDVHASVNRPILHFAIDGSGRLSDGYNYTDLHDAWFCTRSGGCPCPPHTISTISATQPLETVSLLGLAAGGGETKGRIDSFSLHDVCRPIPIPGGGGTGSASDLGDPHIEAFNHFRYDFQAAGEFTAVRSQDGSVDIQVRQQPQLGRRSSNISVLTGVALRDGGHRVGVYVPASDPGAPPARGGRVVLIDGRQVNLGQTPVSLGPGASVVGTSSANGLGEVVVAWPNGTTATITSVFPTFMDLDVSLPSAEQGHVGGILGPFSARPNQVLRTRTGRPIDAHNFNALYGSFADSWRVTSSTSLFDYVRGKTTRSYQLLSFPRGAAKSVSLSPAARANAARVCDRAGVIQAVLLSDCIFDVGVTGNPAFAAGYASETTRAATGCGASPACLTITVSITGDRSVTATVTQPIPEPCADYYPTQAKSSFMALPAVDGTVDGHHLGIEPSLYLNGPWQPGTVVSPAVAAGPYQDGYFTWEIGVDGVYGSSTTDPPSGDPTATTNADGSGNATFVGWKYEEDPSRTISGSESWTCKNRG
jgi:hypothetical protein